MGHGGDGVEGAGKGLEWEAWFTCLEIFSRRSKGRAEFHAPPQAPQGLWHFPVSRLSQSSRRPASAPSPRGSAQPDGTPLTFLSGAARAAVRASSAQVCATFLRAQFCTEMLKDPLPAEQTPELLVTQRDPAFSQDVQAARDPRGPSPDQLPSSPEEGS